MDWAEALNRQLAIDDVFTVPLNASKTPLPSPSLLAILFERPNEAVIVPDRRAEFQLEFYLNKGTLRSSHSTKLSRHLPLSLPRRLVLSVQGFRFSVPRPSRFCFRRSLFLFWPSDKSASDFQLDGCWTNGHVDTAR